VGAEIKSVDEVLFALKLGSYEKSTMVRRAGAINREGEAALLVSRVYRIAFIVHLGTTKGRSRIFQTDRSLWHVIVCDMRL
jgi:hypothetical protein